MDFAVTNHELWICLILYLGASSFYMLHFLRARIKYTRYNNEKRQKNLIVLVKTSGVMMIFVGIVFVIMLFI